jgi:crossover junction endodeoxyribonuclease RuvC
VIIIGVDPGLANTGYGVINAEDHTLVPLSHDCIVTSADTPFPERLLEIFNQFSSVLREYRPDVCAVESIFFAKNAKSAFQVGHARGVCIVAAAREGIPVFEYTPLQIKKALVGVGRAEKAQVHYMIKIILGLKQLPGPEHVSDALAVAVCHANSSKFRKIVGQEQQVYRR